MMIIESWNRWLFVKFVFVFIIFTYIYTYFYLPTLFWDFMIQTQNDFILMTYIYQSIHLLLCNIIILNLLFFIQYVVLSHLGQALHIHWL